eukprot:CAMPEP_0184724748 /NCGR_PEP_ID=MMETSP0314-20130426/28871_1 /TAXON_ID=38298 /ORGANISM="Rhodella maculata, Strain CCMP 736" /LENGTH=129 /DNA_ID=CAMNT_0027189815 /DNA_START=21 /DNA_END=410 /DNA_ORIENTATION=-
MRIKLNLKMSIPQAPTLHSNPSSTSNSETSARFPSTPRRSSAIPAGAGRSARKPAGGATHDNPFAELDAVDFSSSVPSFRPMLSEMEAVLSARMRGLKMRVEDLGDMDLPPIEEADEELELEQENAQKS